MADWLACPYKEMCLAAAAACRCRHLSPGAGRSDFVLKTVGGLSFEHSLISLFSQWIAFKKSFTLLWYRNNFSLVKMVNFEEILDNSNVAIQENILDNLVINSDSTTATELNSLNFCKEETRDIENLISRLPEEVLQKVGVHFADSFSSTHKLKPRCSQNLHGKIYQVLLLCAPRYVVVLVLFLGYLSSFHSFM